MTPDRVHLELTLREAAALSRAASNTIDHPDALEAVLHSPANRQAAQRAHAKLHQASLAARPASQRPVFLTARQTQTLRSAVDELISLAEATELGEGDFSNWTQARLRAIKQASDALNQQTEQP